MKGKPPQEDESAHQVALDVLLWIAGEPERLMPFLAATGLAPDTLRDSAGDPAFLAGVLDHVVGDEAVLLACAGSLGVRPERIAAAWRTLSPPPADDWG